MQTLKIAIDPLLKELYAPEVCWAWRLLLTGAGLPWQEVPLGAIECDIAYVLNPEAAPPCRLCVHANPEAWKQRANYRLRTIEHSDGWSYPTYEGESPRSRPFHFVGGRLECERDIVFDVFWLGTGQEERHWPKNKYGHFDLGGTAYYQEHAMLQALASGIGSSLEKALIDLGFPRGLPRWPYGKRAAACASHDVDYPEVIRWLEPMRILHRRGLQGLEAAISVAAGTRTHWHFASWMEMERRLNTRSAFYFVARRGSLRKYVSGTPDPFYDVRSERFRKTLRCLADEGWEVGLHASYLAYQSQDKFAREKQALEEASGQPVAGNRHHYWHLDPDNQESTLLMHEQIGLKYDASLTHERYIGWRRGLSWPFFPFHQGLRRELKTLQLPTAWMDNQLFGYRSDNPGDRYELLRGLADRVSSQGGCSLIDIHDYVFDDVLFPAWAGTYRKLWDYVLSDSSFWIATPAEVANHWVSRDADIRRASRGLTGEVGIGRAAA
jgi:hypothetical protein